jgi:hypothetical protein
MLKKLFVVAGFDGEISRTDERVWGVGKKSKSLIQRGF